MNLPPIVGAVRSSLGNLVTNLDQAKPVTPDPLPDQPETKDVTVLVYMQGSDKLAYSSDLALDKLEKTAAHPNVNVVAQVTQEPTAAERLLPNMQSLPTRRYLVDSGKRSVVDEKPGQEPLNIGFDSCSMQQVEVGYQLRDYANTMTGSEDDVLAAAYPYTQIVDKLAQQPANATPQAVAKGMVTTYANNAGQGMQSALDLTKLGSVAGMTKAFVDAVQETKTPASLLYTTMMSTAPMEREETLNTAFSFRDMGSFLNRVAGDERYPQAVRDAAKTARSAYGESVVVDAASPDQHKLREDTGATAYFPWKKPDPAVQAQYDDLDWSKDSGWGSFLDYVLKPSDAPKADTRVNTSGLSLGQSLAKEGLYQYKKYIAPDMDTACNYTPTCSTYAREAIEEKGLWEGAKLGTMRFLSCDGSLGGRDPLPGAKDDCDNELPQAGPAAPAPPVPLLSAPAGTMHLSTLQKKLIGTAATVGGLVGSIGLGAVSAVVGAGVGANIAWKTVNGTLNAHEADIAKQDGPAILHGYQTMANPVAGPVTAVQQKFGSSAIGQVAGKISGIGVGIALAAAGSAVQGGSWGRFFGGMWAENQVKDHYGMLPPDPTTEAILQKDYRG
jgi:putative component of membrane protein insertase Oxa1/YidC/SpoIIIJ protein YidD